MQHVSQDRLSRSIGVPAQPTETISTSRDNEAELAVRLAGVKVLLGFLTLGVALADRVFAAGGQPLTGGSVIGFVFVGYLILCYLAVRLGWVSLQSYRVASPLLDVLFAGLLILGTNGYASPFQSWLIAVLACAAFNSSRWALIFATALAIVIQVLVALIPQETPLELRSFIIRTGFLFGFGMLIVSVGNHIARKSLLLHRLEQFGRSASICLSLDEIIDVLLSTLASTTNAKGLELQVEGSEVRSVGVCGQGRCSEFLVESGSIYFGRLKVYSDRALSSDEELLVRTMLDRFCIDHRRMTAAEHSRLAAAQEARLRVADELHDTHIQTLAAVDFNIEALVTQHKLEPKLKKDLQAMRSLVRQSVTDLRGFLEGGEVNTVNDLESLVQEYRAAWPNLVVEADATSGLSRGAWAAIQIMVREGLANARRHARANWAKLRVERKSGLYIVSLETDGEPPVLPLKHYGYGLSRVAAAVEGANGRMFFSGRDGAGACLSAVFEEIEQ